MKRLLTLVIYLFPFFILSQEIDLNEISLKKKPELPCLVQLFKL